MQTLTQRHASQLVLWGFLMLLLLCPSLPAAESQTAATCQPTAADALGPFYKPDAPRRSKVGEGYVLRGVVRSAANCQPLAKALVEFWLAGPEGRYSDAFRASVVSEEAGAYSFESHRPVPYGGRPAHIHIRVTAPGYRTLVTQHYPATGQQQAIVDLVLLPQ
jgi:protocatechuate 3,4-dioxygenase beta subunit